MNDAAALDYFASHGWTLTTAEAIDAGIFKKDLYRLRESGKIIEMSRGVFRSADAPAVEYVDWVSVTKRAPRSVVCLSSALAFWDLTDEIHRQTHIAVPRGSHRPSIDWPPTRVHLFASATFDLGIETVELSSGERIRIYSRERTLADVMRLGKRAATEDEAILVRTYLRQPGSSATDLLDMARRLRRGSSMETLLRVLLA